MKISGRPVGGIAARARPVAVPIIWQGVAGLCFAVAAAEVRVGGWPAVAAPIMVGAGFAAGFRAGAGAASWIIAMALFAMVVAMPSTLPALGALTVFALGIWTSLQLRVRLAKEEGVAEGARRVALQARDLQQANHALAARAEVDPLTGLVNRHGLARRMEACAGRGQGAALILLDLDHFKSYNDTHGHPAGDALLRRLGQILQSCARATDTACRLGGEEFCLFLPALDLAAAQAVAERIRAAVEAEPFPGRETQPGGRVTVSVGVAAAAWASDLDGLYERADRAAYEAKRGGRNRVVVSRA